MSTNTVPRRKLTPHQAEVFERLYRLSGSQGAWVAANVVGSAQALEHLVSKGWAVRDIDHGPRGGEIKLYRPADFGLSARQIRDGEVPHQLVTYFGKEPTLVQRYHPDFGWQAYTCRPTGSVIRRLGRAGYTMLSFSCGDSRQPDFSVNELIR